MIFREDCRELRFKRVAVKGIGTGAGIMKLESIFLKNFRCYKEVTIDLHPLMTVLVANNGQGKTALLDAARIGLWPYVASFDLARTAYADPANTITVNDALMLKYDNAMARQLPSEVEITGDYGEGTTTWKRFRDSEAPRSKTKDDSATRAMKNYGTRLQASIRKVQADPADLPVFGYYGTGRLWKEKRLTQSKKGNRETRKGEENIRTFAYRDCLDPASSYKQFEEWFTSSYIKFRESQIIQLEAGISPIATDPEIEIPVKVIQNAVNVLLKDTGWQDLAYSVTHDKSLILNHPENGTLKVDQLSDGIKNMLAMVADIAYRCTLLNSHMGAKAALQSKGVVMIDEVDMHLHPQWQQTVVEGLTRAFPNIQFIVTTHSPQVLSTVKSECIRLLKQDVRSDSGEIISIARTPDTQTKGTASSDVLAWLMDIDPVPDVEEAQWLSEYKALIQSNEYESDTALHLRTKLEKHFGNDHQAITECDRLIRLTKMKARLPSRNKQGE